MHTQLKQPEMNYTSDIKRYEQRGSEQYILHSIAKTESRHVEQARGDKEALKNDLPRLKRENQRIYDAKVEDSLLSLARGPPTPAHRQAS